MNLGAVVQDILKSSQTLFHDVIFGAEFKFIEVLPSSVRMDFASFDGGVTVKTIREISDKHFVEPANYLTLKFLHGRPEDQALYLYSMADLQSGPPEHFMKGFSQIQEAALSGLADDKYEFASNVGLPYLMGPSEFRARWAEMISEVFTKDNAIPCLIGYSAFAGFLSLIDIMPEGSSALLLVCPKVGDLNYGFVVSKLKGAIQLKYFDQNSEPPFNEFRDVVLLDDIISSGKTFARVDAYFQAYYPKLNSIGQKFVARGSDFTRCLPD